MNQPVSLLAELETDHLKRGGRKATLTVTTEGLFFDVNDEKIAATVTEAITKVIQSNLLDGKAPDGSMLPNVSAATAERREYRHAQSGRGGAPSNRGREATAYAKKRFKQRFSAARLGQFRPLGGQLWGVESGMLVSSVAVEPTGPSSFRVFFAGKRGRFADQKSGRTAVERVFSRIPLWTQRAMAQTQVQTALKKTVNGIVSKDPKKLLADTMKAVKMVKGWLDTARGLAEVAD